MKMTTTDSVSSGSGCPCCAFRMDMFLPESERDQEEPDEDGHENDTQLSVEADTAAVDIQATVPALLLSQQQQQQQHDDDNKPSPVVIVDTHCHAQLDRERDVTYDLGSCCSEEEDNNVATFSNNDTSLRLQQLACAVEPSNFQETLDYASTSDTILPALGIHPWYIPSIISSEESIEEEDKEDSKWLQRLEELLIQHPTAIVGEIGLCKIAKWTRHFEQGKAAAMQIQLKVMKQQLKLAAKLHRPVSVHCVNAHGLFVKALKELAVENNDNNNHDTIPPSIGMHSFTGTAHHVKELLDLEDRVLRRHWHVKNHIDGNNPPPLFYFGFSHAVNYAMCSSEKSRKKGMEAARAVPMERLMVESDVHHPDDVLGGTIGAIAYVAAARNVSPIEIANVTAKNGVAFFMQRG
ncbi:MAG: hypothetical protein SGILL_003115 [Bacillariaceae sp.]